MSRHVFTLCPTKSPFQGVGEVDLRDQIRWTSKALDDVVRLHAFLEPVNPRAAAPVVQQLTKVPKVLLRDAQVGSPLHEFAPREVRRLIVKTYEIRYELVGDIVYILRFWHTREDR